MLAFGHVLRHLLSILLEFLVKVLEAAELGEELVLHGAVASTEHILVRLRQRLKILELSDGPLCPLLQVLDVVHLLVDDRIDSIPELFLLLRVGAVA